LPSGLESTTHASTRTRNIVVRHPLANFVQAVTPFHNGSRFTVTFAPPPDGPGRPMGLVAECSVGPWVRGPDLHYYDVRLGIGWALSEPAGLGIEALSAPIGTVEAPH
jgi:hypothetical protein